MLPHGQRTKHTWKIVGNEKGVGNVSFGPNLWRCRACGMVKAEGPSGTGRLNEGTSIEYSTPAGEVIATNPEKVPACVRGGGE